MLGDALVGVVFHDGGGVENVESGEGNENGSGSESDVSVGIENEKNATDDGIVWV